MKLILSLLALVSSQSAFAYTHFASGNGFHCAMTVASQTVDRQACAVHVKSESKPDAILRDVSGHRYTTVTQIIDNPNCFETRFYAEYADIVGATTAPLSADLGASAKYPAANTFVKYSNDSGQIDSETRHGVLYYINKDADEAAAKRDQANLLAAFQTAFKSLSVAYDPSALTLTIKIDGAGGARTLVEPANFAKGTSSHTAGFRVGLQEPLEIGSKGRKASIDFACAASIR